MPVHMSKWDEDNCNYPEQGEGIRIGSGRPVANTACGCWFLSSFLIMNF